MGGAPTRWWALPLPGFHYRRNCGRRRELQCCSSIAGPANTLRCSFCSPSRRPCRHRRTGWSRPFVGVLKVAEPGSPPAPDRGFGLYGYCGGGIWLLRTDIIGVSDIIVRLADTRNYVMRWRISAGWWLINSPPRPRCWQIYFVLELRPPSPI